MRSYAVVISTVCLFSRGVLYPPALCCALACCSAWYPLVCGFCSVCSSCSDYQQSTVLCEHTLAAALAGCSVPYIPVAVMKHDRGRNDINTRDIVWSHALVPTTVETAPEVQAGKLRLQAQSCHTRVGYTKSCSNQQARGWLGHSSTGSCGKFTHVCPNTRCQKPSMHALTRRVLSACIHKEGFPTTRDVGALQSRATCTQ